MATTRKDNKGRVLRKGESQKKDGTYVYAFTDPYGHRRYSYAKTLKELRDKEEELVRGQLDGLDLYVQRKATVSYVFDRYLSLKANIKSSTRSNYQYMFNTFVRDELGKKLIAELKYSDVKAFYVHLLYEKNFSPATVDNVHSLLHPTFQLAVRDGIIRINPSDGVMAEIKKECGKNKGIRHALSAEQQKSFLDFLIDDELLGHWRPLFIVMFGTGCRIGEIAGLRWTDLDYEKKLIRIDHQLTYYPRGDERKSSYKVEYPKTEAGIRYIPMMPAVCEAFEEEKALQEFTGPNISVVDGVSGFIFKNRYNAVLNPASVNKAIKRIVVAHNAEEEIRAKREKRTPVMLPLFSCHITRHTFCTRLCEQETNVKVIQSIMGHASIETTMDIYAEASLKKNTEAIEKLAAKLDFV